MNEHHAKCGCMECGLKLQVQSLTEERNQAQRDLKWAYEKIETLPQKVAEMMRERDAALSRESSARELLAKVEGEAAAMRASIEDIRQAFTKSQLSWQPQTIVAVFDRILRDTTAGASMAARLKASEAAVKAARRSHAVGGYMSHVMEGGHDGPATCVASCPGCATDMALAAYDATTKERT